MDQPSARDLGARTRPRILLGEDDADLRCAVATSLQRAGYCVVEAEDGAELVTVLCATPPGHFALVICDQRMPSLEGVQCLSMTGSRAPFIILSAYVDDELRKAAARFGAVRLLSKPVDLARLLHVVEGLTASAPG